MGIGHGMHRVGHLKWLRMAVVGVAALAATGCGGSPKAQAPLYRPLTIDQAVQLASTLYLNYQDKGAEISAQLVYSPTEYVGIQGLVDFVDHTGHLYVTTTITGKGESAQYVDYTPDAVYESVSAPSQPNGIGWTERAPDPTARPIDRLIQLIVALASPQRDNPLLVQQSQARWEGSRVFDEVKVNVYRYNPSITYLVGVANGLLYRFQGTVQGFTGPVTIDLTHRGPQSTPPPPPSQIVPAQGG